LPDEPFVNQYVGRYDGEIATADSQVGRLVGWLRERGWYDRATIIMTADHGESMGEGGRWFKHGSSVDEAQAHVPLIVKFDATSRSAARNLRIAEPVSTVNVFPTILAAAKLDRSDGDPYSADLRRIATERSRRHLPVITELARPEEPLTIAARSADCEVWWS